MMDMARSFIAEIGLVHKPDLVLDRSFAASEDGGWQDSFASVERCSLVEASSLSSSPLLTFAAEGKYDAIAVFYPDALGLGCEVVEKHLVDRAGSEVIAVNGRRRIFPLDPDTRLALRTRRALARTRVPEMAFALIVFPVAAVCAAVDLLLSRR